MVPPGRFCDRCQKPLAPDPNRRSDKDEQSHPAGEQRSSSAGLPPQESGEKETAAEQIRAANERPRYKAEHQQSDGKPKQAAGEPIAQKSVSLAVDAFSVLYEGLACTARFQLFVPAGEVLHDVRLSLANDILGLKRETSALLIDDESRMLPAMRRKGNLIIGFPKMELGAYVWNLVLSFYRNGVRYDYVSCVEFVVLRNTDSRAVAEQVIVTINNNIKAEGAARPSVANMHIADDLRSAMDRGENPTVVLARYARNNERAWCSLSLNAEKRSSLPQQPEGFVTNRLTLNLGTRWLKLIAGRSCVTFGRRDDNDIFLRPKNPDTCSDAEALPYFAISKYHCRFESSGDVVAIREGWLDELMKVRPSSNGTFWNGQQVYEKVALKSGEEGKLTFGLRCPGVHVGNCVSMQAKACSPKFACANCPYSNRDWCGNGRPSLALTRLDGISETFVCMWSCLHLGEIDRAYEGVVIFRKDGAFAWCRGERCGWLVPGTKVETEYGAVTVSA